MTVKIQGTKGWPDRIFVPWRGAPIWCEFKATSGRLSPMQKHIRDELLLRGIIVHTVKSIKQFKEIYGRI